MTTQRAISFQADLDISDVTRGLRRIEQQARRTGSTVGRVGGGLGRAGGGIGRTVGAGAGIGAGLAVFELAFEKIFELFEGTPILETFVMALDGIFKAAAPLIGVLLEGLTPILLALTPAIEPLARALTPLIELLGAGLLIVIQAITPAIVLFAQGLEKVTTFIRDVVLGAFRFIVDQLNKLPFIDIQANLDATGGSFDAMAGQIETAGDKAEVGSGKVASLGSAIATTTESLGVQIQAEYDAAAASTFLSGQTALTEKQTEDLAIVMADFEISMDDAAGATIRATVAARASEEATGKVIIADYDAAAASTFLSGQTGLTASQARKLAIVMEDFETNMASSAPPVSALDQAIADMTTQITEAQTAADLNSEAFAALSPELMAAAAELGLFGQTVSKVGDAAGDALDDIDSSLLRARRAASGAAEITQRFADGSGQSGRFVPGSGGRQGSGDITAAFRAGGRLQFQTANSGRDILSARDFESRRADVEAFLAAQVQVNVRIGDETVDAVVDTSENRRGSE